MPVLRPYQQKLADDVRSQFVDHRRVLAVSPTGSGKTTVFCYITESAKSKNKRVIIAAHRVEIINQISLALYAAECDHAIIAPGYPRRAAPVCVAMIQTLSRRIGRIDEPDLIVVDEAHHAVSATYRKVIGAFPRARVLGVTATPIRMDGTGLKEDFDVMVLGPTIPELMDSGYLARARHIAPEIAIDTSDIEDVDSVAGRDAVAEQINQNRIVGDVVAHYREYLDGRPAIAFLPTVATSERFAQIFTQAGIASVSVDGSMHAYERSRRVRGLADGSVKILTNCDILGEGFDVPSVAGSILLRPTNSLALYMQQIGRSLRPKPDGSAAIVLDHVGNVHRGHGTIDAPRDWSLAGKPKKSAGIQACSLCHRVFKAGTAAALAKAECDRGVACPFVGSIRSAESGDDPADLVVEDGRLVEVGFVATRNPLLDPALSSYRERRLRDLLEEAQNESDIAVIARARGYPKAWINLIMHQRRSSV